MARRLAIAPPVYVQAPLLHSAFAFAERAHRGQRRKDGQAFIAHPVAVARLLAARGYGEPVLAAALLHDVVEDTPTTLGRLRTEFGDVVAELVASVSEDPSLAGAERKVAYRERVRRSSRAARAICAADKICNLTDLQVIAARGDLRMLATFHGGLDSQIARFEAELGMLDQADADPGLRDTLRTALDALRDEAGRLAPHAPALRLAA
jgi:(p)ppGpp synthase/HD superfamily hydrolase